MLPPSPKEILGKYLDIFATETREDMKRLEPYWDEHGCSPLRDGWTQRCPPSILWFIAIERLCCSKKIINIYINKIMKKKIKEVRNCDRQCQRSYKKAGIKS